MANKKAKREHFLYGGKARGIEAHMMRKLEKEKRRKSPCDDERDEENPLVEKVILQLFEL